MWERIQRTLDRIESRLSLLLILQGAGVLSIGAIAAWFATGAEWLNQYGSLAWLYAGLIGALMAALIMLALAHLRGKWIEGAAIKKWKDAVHSPNPLQKEFHTLRVRLLDIANPLSNDIERKRFIDCEVIGPGNVIFAGSAKIQDAIFYDCHLVIVRPQAELTRASFISLNDCHFLNCRFYNFVFFALDEHAPQFYNAGLSAVSFQPNSIRSSGFTEQTLPPLDRAAHRGDLVLWAVAGFGDELHRFVELAARALLGGRRETQRLSRL